MTVAHVAGIPLEEGVFTLTPVAGVLALLVTTRLRQLRARWPRRNPHDA